MENKLSQTTAGMIVDALSQRAKVTYEGNPDLKLRWPLVPSEPMYVSNDPTVANICDGRSSDWTIPRSDHSLMIIVRHPGSAGQILESDDTMIVETNAPFDSIVTDIVGLFTSHPDSQDHFSAEDELARSDGSSQYARFFRELIEGKALDESTFNEMMVDSGLNSARGILLSTFKVSGLSPWKRNKVLCEASKINNGQNHLFFHEGNLLVLAYTSNEHVWASLGGIAFAHLDLGFFLDSGIRAGMSGVIPDIRDIDKLYKQTLIAIKYHDLIIEEMKYSSRVNPMPICPFTFVLPYYTTSDPNVDHEILKLFFSASPAEQVYQDDVRHKTNATQVIWTYLCCGCNASATAEKLYMHRNSVYKHVRKYSEQFGCDFSIIHLRNCTILDFQHMFMVHGFKNVFDMGNIPL